MSAQKQEITAFDSFSFGLWVGISISLLAVLIFIIVYDNLSIENTSVFSRDFPTWRGIAIFILYIWVLGFNIFMYEKYKISHRLIFKFHDHHYSTSTDIFKVAGSFTTLYLTLFLFYLLQITNIIGPSNIFVPEYMSLMMWGSLLFYLLVPLPILNYQGRLYALKLIIGSLISPITGVQFSIIWMTDQWISLSLPLRDFAYTICYYKEIDFKKPT